MSQLITKHRPTKLQFVEGQEGAVKAFSNILEKKTSQSFLLSGPSGTGKTTLARIGAAAFGALERDIFEVDAATFSGVDKVREIQLHMSYRPVGGGSARACIVDECHRLSSQAWDAFLKTIEEPVKGVYWFFCTTNPAKVPKTIKTRCSPIVLKDVSEESLRRVVSRVIKREGLDIPDGVVDVVIREAANSPRQAILNLSMVTGCTTQKEAKKVLHSASESDATRDLCNFLLNGGSWQKAMAIVERLAGENYEGVRIIVCNFLGAVLKNAKSDDKAIGALMTLENWCTPYNQSEGVAPLLRSIGRTIFNEE